MTGPLRQAAASPPGVRRPRLGFAGVGWIGRHRLEAIARTGLADISALADPCVETLEQASRLAPSAARHADFDALLGADLDGVVLATPSALHAAEARAALDRGLAVFSQKPLGRNAGEVRSVVDAARAADRLLGVDLSYRHLEATRAVRRLQQDGELGEVYGIDLVFHNAYGPDKDWFYDPDLSGGGCVIDLGVHLADLALWMLGFPQVTRVSSALFAHGRRLPPGAHEVEDYAVATFETAGSAVVRIACSWNLPAGCDAVIGASFYGTRGGAAISNVAGSFYEFTAEALRGTSRETICAPPDAWGGRAAVSWVQRLLASRRFDPEAEHLVQVADVLDRIYHP